jgi:hypothetical protein
MRSMTHRNPRWLSNGGKHLCSMTHRRLGAASSVTACQLYVARPVRLSSFPPAVQRKESMASEAAVGRAAIVAGPSLDRCYDRALLVRDGVIAHVFSPVERAAANPCQVLAWMDLHAC